MLFLEGMILLHMVITPNKDISNVVCFAYPDDLTTCRLMRNNYNDSSLLSKCFIASLMGWPEPLPSSMKMGQYCNEVSLSSFECAKEVGITLFTLAPLASRMHNLTSLLKQTKNT